MVDPFYIYIVLNILLFDHFNTAVYCTRCYIDYHTCFLAPNNVNFYRPTY